MSELRCWSYECKTCGAIGEDVAEKCEALYAGLEHQSAEHGLRWYVKSEQKRWLDGDEIANYVL